MTLKVEDGILKKEPNQAGTATHCPCISCHFVLNYVCYMCTECINCGLIFVFKVFLLHPCTYTNRLTVVLWSMFLPSSGHGPLRASLVPRLFLVGARKEEMSLGTRLTKSLHAQECVFNFSHNIVKWILIPTCRIWWATWYHRWIYSWDTVSGDCILVYCILHLPASLHMPPA